MVMTMKFYVYENYPADKAIVHLASCPNCNSGKGVTGRMSTHNGRWLGPFDAQPVALEAAHATGRRIVDLCARCDPN